MRMEKVLVVGSGTMGQGIAQVCAQAGLSVVLVDLTRQYLERALTNIDSSIARLIEKGKLIESREVILSRITAETELTAAADADIAIEAVFENLGLKQETFNKLDGICAPKALLASNTSAIPITELARVTKRPDRVLGLHFFNPAPIMEIVEVVKGNKTSEESMKAALVFVKKLGKEPVRVEKDVPGFLINRIHLVGYVEAIRLVEQGVGSVEDIDKGVRSALGRKMGPFETGDLVGLDVSYGALNSIYQESQDGRFFPPRLLRRKVEAGELGRKTGRGWYEYQENNPKQN